MNNLADSETPPAAPPDRTAQPPPNVEYHGKGKEERRYDGSSVVTRNAYNGMRCVCVFVGVVCLCAPCLTIHTMMYPPLMSSFSGAGSPASPPNLPPNRPQKPIMDNDAGKPTGRGRAKGRGGGRGKARGGRYFLYSHNCKFADRCGV